MYVNGTFDLLSIAGGTIDITAHEVLHGGGLRELHQASGGDWGGSSVNKQFLDYMASALGQDVIDAVKQESPSDWLEFQNNFEMKKCTYKTNSNKDVTLRLPLSFSEIFQKKNSKTLMEHIKASCYNSDITVTKDKIRLSNTLFKSLFDTSIKNILKKMSEVIKQVPNINSILVVGGFAECKLLTGRIRETFINHRILIPEEPSLAVLKGAVLFGFNPNAIEMRVCRYTYGIANQRKYVKGKDPVKSMRITKGRYFCDDAFDKHVERGSVVTIGQFQQEGEYRTVRKDQRMVFLELFASTESNPNLVTDDSCHHIGVLEIQLQEGEKSDGVVFVKINLSGTELEVEATVKPSGRHVSTTCNFLG